MTDSLSFRSLQKSSYVVREMTRYYFPLYDVSPRDYLTYAPRLVALEAIVFDVDRELETGSGRDVFRRVGEARDSLAELLLADGPLDEPTERELANLVEYARLEGRLVRGGPSRASDVWRACDLRTSDVRLLHRALVRMIGVPCREDWFDLMWPLECLMDIELDLDDYAEDAATGGYNTLLMLERLLGEAPARACLADRIAFYGVLHETRLAEADRPTRERFDRLRADYRKDHAFPPMPARTGALPGPRPAARVV